MNKTVKIYLSFLFLVITAFGTHQFFSYRLETKNRNIASFMDRTSGQQVQWEQQVAKDISTMKPKATGLKRSEKDQLFFEFLQGQYNYRAIGEKDRLIELSESNEGVVIDTKSFVEKFGQQLQNFSTFEITPLHEKEEKVSLMDQYGAPTGFFIIHRNDQGRVQTILIQSY